MPTAAVSVIGVVRTWLCDCCYVIDVVSLTLCHCCCITAVVTAVVSRLSRHCLRVSAVVSLMLCADDVTDFALLLLYDYRCVTDVM